MMRRCLFAIFAVCFATPVAGGEPIKVGVEYAFPGMGEAFANMGAHVAKVYPESHDWQTMQPRADAPIDFAHLDRMIVEYQKAGVRDVMLGLRSRSKWASKSYHFNPTPKPQHVDDYRKWIGAIVERYDKDGRNDMPGLRYPVRYIEIGVEFSSYEPEPVGEYLAMLGVAYKAAHAASDDVVVMHVAFLTANVFDGDPTPDKYEHAFSGATVRDRHHDLADMRRVLDRPELFDAVNVHALTAPDNIERQARWLRWEMKRRKYTKPIVISDTTPNLLIGWGPADVCDKPKHAMGILTAPAVEADRCRLAAHFRKLLNKDADALAWTHGFVARDMAKKVVIAAGSGVSLINTSFMEDLHWQKLKLWRAGAGMSAWGGMVETTIEHRTQRRTVIGYRPSYHAMKRLLAAIDGYTKAVRIAHVDSTVRLYRFDRPAGPLFVVWHEPKTLILPGDAIPTRRITLKIDGAGAALESLRDGDAVPESRRVGARNGMIELTLSPTPLLVTPRR